ncbi:GNAT family N-acetyltransferase [Salidesulfovibrio onnuriiensis]|uniref:GNAT family N-acetyltransferase n=1 Tax=Salidesulfovibrio onnuriiensis TaxID=2583823 RepID=UPI0011CBB944|nr:GNAT family N-acetyltransferase [Salidesulfovibrio onnuriiensis]
MSITVRKATEKDAPILESVMYASFLASYGEMMPQNYVNGVLENDVIGKLSRQKWHECFLAEEDGRPVGVMQLQGNYIAELWVHPDHQGKGVGGKLIQAAEEHAREQGHAHLTLCVYGCNTNAREFYRNKGFVLERMEASERVPEETVCYKVKWLSV